MEKYYYIKRSVAKQFLCYDKPLSTEDYNNIGETWQDYLNGNFVPLSSEQAAFHEANPNATVKEVWEMEINEPVGETLETAKIRKTGEIDMFNSSPSVNSFSIGGKTMWLTVEERQQIATQISASEAVNRETMTRWYDGTSFNFPLATWKQMLVALEVYAGDALNVTEAHKAAVNALQTIEEVDAYNYMTGYPEKLMF